MGNSLVGRRIKGFALLVESMLSLGCMLICRSSNGGAEEMMPGCPYPRATSC